MKSSVSACPVPFEQQPINEYQSLKESWFYRWGSLELWGYLQPLVVLWVISWLVAGPVAATSFATAKHPLQFFLSGAVGASVIPTLTLLRLYLGWDYIRDRLNSETIPYEESGWYDGQYWTKPAEVLTRDRLIVTYEIQPILQRVKRTFGIFALLLLGVAIVWMLL